MLNTLSADSHSKLVICDNGLDKILGYVESHTLLTLYLQQEVVDLTDSRLLRKALFIPDTLSLYEVLSYLNPRVRILPLSSMNMHL